MLNRMDVVVVVGGGYEVGWRM